MNATERRKAKALLNQARKLQAAIFELESSMTSGSQPLFEAYIHCAPVVQSLIAASAKPLCEVID